MGKVITRLIKMLQPEVAEDDLMIVQDVSVPKTKVISIAELRKVLIGALSIVTDRIANGAVTTSKFKPNVIQSNFGLAGARYSNTQTNVNTIIPNTTMTYTAGSVDEKLIITSSVMANKDAGSEGAVWIGKNGVQQGYELYYYPGVTWYRGVIHSVIDVPANTTVTLALYGRNVSGGTFSVINEVEKWKPSMTGFAVAA